MAEVVACSHLNNATASALIDFAVQVAAALVTGAKLLYYAALKFCFLIVASWPLLRAAAKWAKKKYVDKYGKVPAADGVAQLPLDDFIKFNVGGSVLQTTRATLSMYDSALKAMASGDHAVRLNDEGCILIDRDGKHFSTILNFLRDGETSPLPPDYQAVQEILAEAEYYSFEMLIAVCKEKLAELDARRMATYFRTVYTAEELDMVIKSGEPLIMFAFNENDKWDSKHNSEAFAHAVMQFATYRRIFHAFHYVHDMTPKTIPGCSFDIVHDGKLLMRVPVLEASPSGGYASVHYEKRFDRAIQLLLACIASKLAGGTSYVSDLKYLTAG